MLNFIICIFSAVGRRLLSLNLCKEYLNVAKFKIAFWHVPWT